MQLTRSRSLAFSFVLTALLFAAVAHASGPKLELIDPVHDFGVISQGQKVTHEFRFKNSGDAELVLNRVVPSCGCTASSIDTNNIAPGQEGRIKVEFDSTGFSGRKIKTVRVFSNDQSDPTSLLTIQGEIQSDIIIEPDRVFFGNVARNKQHSQDITIRARPGSGASIENVSTFSSAVTVDFIERKEDLYKLKVTLKPQAEIGEVRTRLVVHVKDRANVGASAGAKARGSRAVNIPVFAAIKREVEAKPGNVSFGVVDPTQPTSQQIKLLSRSGKAPAIVEVESSTDAIEANIIKASGKSDSDTVLVKLLPERLKTDLKATLLIKTDAPDVEPIVVNVFAVLPPRHELS